MKTESIKGNSKTISKSFWFTAAGIIYIFLFFIPIILKSGLYSDDIYNINSPAVEYFGTSVREFTSDIIGAWISMGRFYPLAFYAYGLYDLVPSVAAYKLCICISIAINSYLIYKLVRMYLPKEYALCSLLLFPVFCNMSATFHSAVYGFHMLIQNNLTLILLSFIFLQMYLDKRKKRYMVISCISYAAALLMYEIPYPFILVHIFICAINEKNVKKTIINSIPLVSIWSAGIAANIIVRLNATVEKYTSIGFDIKKIIVTFVNQLSSSFPIIRYIKEAPQFGMPKNISGFFESLAVSDIVVAVSLMAMVLLGTIELKKHKSAVDFRKSVICIILGLCIAVFPAALIALSSKYQSIITFGVGYIPTYISSFGIAMCGAVLWINCVKKIMESSEKIAVTFSLISGVFVVSFTILNLFLGRATVNAQNKITYYDRSLICDAADFGLFDAVSPNDLLVGTTLTMYDAGDPPLFYSNINKRKVQAVYYDVLPYIKRGEDFDYSYVKINYTGDIYATYHTSDSSGNGIVLLAPMLSSADDVCICSGPVFCYIKNDKTDSDITDHLRIDNRNIADFNYTALKQGKTESLFLIDMGDSEFSLDTFSFIDDIYNFNGSGTMDDPFTISSAEELAALSKNVNNGFEYEDCYFIQTDDIDLENFGVWCPIGSFSGNYSFKGIYNGDGHVISNLKTIGSDNNGLFGKLSGIVCNLGIESGDIRGGCVGSIASHSFSDKAMIINCYNKADINGIRCGGIADNFTGGRIICCLNYGRIQCEENGMQGGITSYTAATVWGCYADTELTNAFFDGELIDSEVKQELSLADLNDKLELAKAEFDLDNIPIKYWDAE